MTSREAIIRAATRVMAEQGYAGASMEEIAVRVGIRKASLFHHFRSKEEIFVAIVLRSIDAAFAAIEPVLLAGLAPRERLQQAVFVHTREACCRREENLVLMPGDTVYVP